MPKVRLRTDPYHLMRTMPTQGAGLIAFPTKAIHRIAYVSDGTKPCSGIIRDNVKGYAQQRYKPQLTGHRAGHLRY